jgi:hypothetical protein
MLGLASDPDPPISTSGVAGIIGVHHHTWSQRFHLKSSRRPEDRKKGCKDPNVQQCSPNTGLLSACSQSLNKDPRVCQVGSHVVLPSDVNT